MMKESNPKSPASASTWECDGRIEEILEVLYPPPDNVPSRCQQLPTPSVSSVGKAPSEVVVLLQGLTEPLPGPGFCLCHSLGRGTLGLTVPVSRLRSPTSQPQPVGLLQPAAEGLKT
ncbi:hypothetical protein AMECASPLE_023291 [Ameca splendens]|uniref:Uncharacterized protein n=1 Tax=Ameca splendens TaxID=208324 RepID=A0ABV0XSX6_9TELE